MNSLKTISFFFRKSPVFRGFLTVLLAFSIIGITTFASFKIKARPIIEEVNPPIGSPGDIITITGKDFGKDRNTSYVEIGGSRITASSYLEWSDTQIRIQLPANVKNGLVYVGTGSSRSEPSFFANRDDIPSLVHVNEQNTTPTVTDVSVNGSSIGLDPTKQLRIKTGDFIEIIGNNFGSSSEDANVFFSSMQEDATAANRDNFDYVYWSDTEIQLYVPDGISDGYFYIKNNSSTSQQVHFTNSSAVGKKTFPVTRTYLLETTSDISDVSADKNSMMTIRMPYPLKTISQHKIEMTECSPTPTLTNFQHTLIFQEQSSSVADSRKTTFKANFAVTVSETLTEINTDKIGNYNNVNPLLLSVALKADVCVPSDDKNVVELAKKIIGTEKNPHRKAKKIYDYMLDNFQLLQEIRTGEVLPVDLISTGSGDAYDFSMIYTALLRASGVPALPCAGLLVDRTMARRAHWWTEFYLPDLGWIPVDIAIPAGLSYNGAGEERDKRTFYFGNMDCQHIVFSRGYNEIKPASASSVTVQFPRSYALQSIWEEVGTTSVKYSSFWNLPMIIGIY